MRDERDEMIDRIVDELKTLPPVPADATARVLARVDATRRGEDPGAYAFQDDDDVIFFPTSTEEMRASPSGLGQPLRATTSTGESRAAGRFRRRFVVSLPAAIGYAMAATLAGFLIRGAVPRPPAPVAVTEPRTAQPNRTLGTVVPVTPAAATRRDMQEAPVTVQFVLDARHAKSVAVVGDFNSWDGGATPLQRDSTTGVWSALVNVHPGRHVYAFLVDGSVWTLDPNAPRTKDVDYGTDQSVMIVGAQ